MYKHFSMKCSHMCSGVVYTQLVSFCELTTLANLVELSSIYSVCLYLDPYMAYIDWATDIIQLLSSLKVELNPITAKLG